MVPDPPGSSKGRVFGRGLGRLVVSPPLVPKQAKDDEKGDGGHA